MLSHTCSCPVCQANGKRKGAVLVTLVLDVVKYILGNEESNGGGTQRSASINNMQYWRANSGGGFVNAVLTEPTDVSNNTTVRFENL